MPLTPPPPLSSLSVQHNTCNKYCYLYPSCSYVDRIKTYAKGESEVGENLLAGPGHVNGAVAVRASPRVQGGLNLSCNQLLAHQSNSYI